MFQVPLEIKASDITSEYNHLHHARSLFLMEQARLRYLEHIGFPNEEFFRENLFLVITNISIRYLRELRVGPIQISCENPQIKGKIVSLQQRIFNARGKVAVDAIVESSFLCGIRKRAVPPPAEFAASFQSVTTPPSR